MAIRRLELRPAISPIIYYLFPSKVKGVYLIKLKVKSNPILRAEER